MHLRYVFSELRQGLRRNLSMHVAVVLTLFVSLTLVGMGAVLKQQADKAEEYWGSQLEITVFLCNDNDANVKCVNEVTPAQKEAIIEVVENNPEVDSYRTESKAEAFEKVKLIYGEQDFEGPDAVATEDAMQETIWIRLKDARKYEGVVSAVVGLDGVSKLRDQRQVLDPIYAAINALQWGALGTAVFLVVAALLLVANTIRLAALARRREIGIMRLVGASTLYIALPFLMEAVVIAVIGAGLAIAALAGFMWFGIHQQLEHDLQFMPWVGLDAYLRSVLVIAILGPLLTVTPTLLLTRKYLKV